MPKGPASCGAPRDHLPRSFYTTPGQGSTMMTRAEVRDTMFATGGEIIARGNLWDVVARTWAGAPTG